MKRKAVDSLRNYVLSQNKSHAHTISLTESLNHLSPSTRILLLTPFTSNEPVNSYLLKHQSFQALKSLRGLNQRKAEMHAKVSKVLKGKNRVVKREYLKEWVRRWRYEKEIKERLELAIKI